MNCWIYLLLCCSAFVNPVLGQVCGIQDICLLKNWVSWDCRKCCTRNAPPDVAVQKRGICCPYDVRTVSECLSRCNISLAQVERNGLCTDHCQTDCLTPTTTTTWAPTMSPVATPTTAPTMIHTTTPTTFTTSPSTKNGGWSPWEHWSACTKGLSTRIRSCNNPLLSTLGNFCAGRYEENKACTPGTNMVAFTVTNPNTTLVLGRPIFTKVVTNLGGGNDVSTATFQCPTAGLYLFTLTIRANGNYNVYCHMKKGAENIVIAETTGLETGSAIAYLQLSVGDSVSIGSCGNWDNVYKSYGSSFSGSLIQAM